MSADRAIAVGSLLSFTIAGAFLCADELCDGDLRVLALMAGALLAAIVLTACELAS
jgi:hypothetical protein